MLRRNSITTAKEDLSAQISCNRHQDKCNRGAQRHPALRYPGVVHGLGILLLMGYSRVVMVVMGFFRDHNLLPNSRVRPSILRSSKIIP